MKVYLKTPAFKKIFQRIRENELANRLQNTFWIEIAADFDEGRLKALQPIDFETAFLFLPVPEMVLENKAAFYEKFCSILTYLRSRIPRIIILALEKERDQALHTLISLFKKDLGPANHAIPKSDAMPEAEILFVRKGIIQHWDPDQFRQECLAELAEHILKLQIRKEEQQLPCLRLSEDLEFVGISGETFNHIYQHTLEGLTDAFRRRNFQPPRHAVEANFGDGRQDSPHLLQALHPDILLRPKASFPSILGLAIRPDEQLVRIAMRLRELIPTLYRPGIHIFDRLMRPEFEEGKTEDIFSTPLWQEQQISHIDRQISDLIMAHENELQTLRRMTSSDRRRRRREITQNIQQILQDFREQVNQEFLAILQIENLFLLSPYRAATAYQKIYQSVFSSICRLFPVLWGWRTFMGIPLPLRVPSLFYKRSNILRTARELLLEILRLMNFHLILYFAMISFRDLVHRFRDELNRMEHIDGYSTHTQNILKELEICAKSQEPHPNQLMDLLLNLDQIFELPSEFPQVERVVENFSSRLKSPEDNQKVNFIAEIDNLIRRSRESDVTLPESPSMRFVPVYFHKQEAWRMPQQMLQALENEKSISELIETEFQRCFPETFSGDVQMKTYFYSYPIIKKVKNLFDEEFFLNWKREALLDAEKPLYNDILKKTFPFRETHIRHLMDEGIHNGFWEVNGARLGLTTKVFNGSPDKIRIKYFQRKRGLSRHEINNLPEEQKEVLLNWLYQVIRQLKATNPISEKRVQHLLKSGNEDLFNLILGIKLDYPAFAESDYYGKPSMDEDKDFRYFYLTDTQAEKLWPYFVPQTLEAAKPRYFIAEKIRDWLKNKEEFQILSELFYNYCLIKQK